MDHETRVVTDEVVNEDDSEMVEMRKTAACEMNKYCLEPRGGNWVEWNESNFRNQGGTGFALKFIEEHGRVRMLRKDRNGNCTIILCKNCIRLIDMYFGKSTKETVYAMEGTKKIVYVGSDSDLESDSDTDIYI